MGVRSREVGWEVRYDGVSDLGDENGEVLDIFRGGVR